MLSSFFDLLKNKVVLARQTNAISLRHVFPHL